MADEGMFLNGGRVREAMAKNEVDADTVARLLQVKRAEIVKRLNGAVRWSAIDVELLALYLDVEESWLQGES